MGTPCNQPIGHLASLLVDNEKQIHLIWALPAFGLCSNGTVRSNLATTPNAIDAPGRDMHYMRRLHLWQTGGASCAPHEKRLRDKRLISGDTET